MDYPVPLSQATLIRRYKRFLADCELPDGRVETVYCPNTGAMTHCADPGVQIWLSRSSNAKRKYPLSWEQSTDSWGNRVGIHSGLANKLVGEALFSRRLAELECCHEVYAHDPWLREMVSFHSEVRVPDEKVRLDFSVVTPRGQVWVEVKSVTLPGADGLGLFPDAVTSRGLKQITALINQLSKGRRALLVYCVQNTGVRQFALAHSIDPAYAEAVKVFHAAGGRVLAVGARLNAEHNTIEYYIPWMTS